MLRKLLYFGKNKKFIPLLSPTEYTATKNEFGLEGRGLGRGRMQGNTNMLQIDSQQKCM